MTSKTTAQNPVTEIEYLVVKGAAEHNLKRVNLEVPKKKLVVFTGVSGSGKSSLAFDTIFAEGQRRYVESLSAYARQFLGQMEKPKYDAIKGLSPTISIEQKSVSRNPRSTVGTITEINDYLRVLFARAGSQVCHVCSRGIEAQSSQQMVERIARIETGKKFLILAPLVENRKGEHRDKLEGIKQAGFARLRVNGEILNLDDEVELDKNKRNRVDVVIDRLVSRPDRISRLTDSIEQALKVGKGRLVVSVIGDDQDILMSEFRHCAYCELSFPEISPQSFSFNSPVGMCKTCNGLGKALRIDPERVIPDRSLSIDKNAVKGFNIKMARWFRKVLRVVVKIHNINLKTPFEDLTAHQQNLMLFGDPTETYQLRLRGNRTYEVQWEGIIPRMERMWRESESEDTRLRLSKYFTDAPCLSCEGSRLRPESRAVTIGDFNIVELSQMSIGSAYDLLTNLKMEGNTEIIATDLLREIVGRLRFLRDVGLNYLTLDRSAPTLSGGEAQRIRLASQMGSELTGVLYILDEPSIGLHARDNDRLIQTLEQLRDLGNSVIVVEHDADMMQRSDWLVDFGPGAGTQGGEIVASGPPQTVTNNPLSLTGQYLSGTRVIPQRTERRKGNKKNSIQIRGAAANNLKNIDVHFPNGLFTCVTGVSGAGKSSLVNGILYPAAARHLNGSQVPVGEHRDIRGLEAFDKVVNIDQSPIGRTPRSNSATYTKLWDDIRKVFASTRESKAYGYAPGRFSFNVKGGRCENCQGAGVTKVEMHFLADVYVTCDICSGKRFNEATLRVTYRELTIADILALTIREALHIFEHHPKIARVLQTLTDVGLDYIKLGQPATTLSGGEAQRIKLSRELSKRATGQTLYILDEPSTGLHFEDVRKLLEVIQRLVDQGNTVVMIEHNLDIIRTADWIIDIGPEGGGTGGQLIAHGTPEKVSKIEESPTGRYLKDLLERAK
jgi:excinuclease ABC subunit A